MTNSTSISPEALSQAEESYRQGVGAMNTDPPNQMSALNYFRLAITLNPGGSNGRFYVDMGHAYLALDQLQDALNAYDCALLIGGVVIANDQALVTQRAEAIRRLSGN
jgi:tetratricopeptide (TPR) repeat protein